MINRINQKYLVLFLELMFLTFYYSTNTLLTSVISGQGLQVIPCPQQVNKGGSYFTFKNELTIVLDNNHSASDQFTADELIKDLKYEWNIKAKTGEMGTSPSILLTHHQSTKSLKDQGYQITTIGGKRESRRHRGDLVLKEQDILEQKIHPYESFTTTWGIDLHHPAKSNKFTGEPFRSIALTKVIKPYPVPYRCLYSRNISNMFMPGRDISVTHVALGTLRVQRTTGMMGEVVGMAASICKKYDALPRDVYQKYLEI